MFSFLSTLLCMGLRRNFSKKNFFIYVCCRCLGLLFCCALKCVWMPLCCLWSVGCYRNSEFLMKEHPDEKPPRERPPWEKTTLMRDHPSFKTTRTLGFLCSYQWAPDLRPLPFENLFKIIFHFLWVVFHQGVLSSGIHCFNNSLLTKVEPKFPIGLHASVSTPSPPPPLLISLTFYICTLLLDLCGPVLTPASSKFHSISARQKLIVLSVTLVLLSGTHCHCTLETLQLLTPSKNLSVQPPRIGLAHISLICSA